MKFFVGFALGTAVGLGSAAAWSSLNLLRALNFKST